MKPHYIENMVNSIVARKNRERLDQKRDNGVMEARRGFLPKPPPPRLSTKRTSHMRREQITKVVEGTGDWEGPINWGDPLEWRPEQSPMENDPQQGGEGPFHEDDQDIQEQNLDQDDQTDMEMESQESNAQRWALQEQWDEKYKENAPNHQGGQKWESHQDWHEMDWSQSAEQYEQEQSPMDWQEKPVSAPAIMPIKGVKIKNRPRFVPLNTGKGGSGGGKLGYPTPLTHPTPPNTPRGGFVHPINDPKMASFFAKHKKGDRAKGGWIPPEPPVPMGFSSRIPSGQQLALPADPRAGTASKKRVRSPFMSENDEIESTAYRGGTPKRQQVLVQMGSGKLVLAEYWDA